MNPNEFEALAAQLAKLNNVDQETAEDWLSLIGDTPEFADSTSDLVLLPNSENKTILWPQ